jgi:hypothetical protein
MYDLIDDAITVLVEVVKSGDITPDGALKFTQAVCNLANAKATLVQTDKRQNE